MSFHILTGGGHVAGLTHVELVPAAQAELSLVRGRLLCNLVLVLDSFAMVGEQRGDLGEIAEMTL